MNSKKKVILKNKISTTKHTQKNLNRFEMLSHATEEGIWDYNLATGETYYNNTIGKMFGFTQDEMGNNKEWWETNLHPEDKARIINEVDKAVNGKQSTWWGTYLFRCKDGNYKSVLERLYIIRNKLGRLERILGTMQDLSKVNTVESKLISERKLSQQKMTQKILTKEEEEKKEIGDELNENINQILASINFYINLAKEEAKLKNNVWLNKASELISSSISGVRKISNQLSPHTLGLLGLQLALKNHLSKLKEENNIDSSLLYDENVVPHLTPQKQIALYRIAYYQFVNICTHSKANFIILKIEATKKSIKLTIKDNGVGFNNSDLQYGFGFSKIQSITDAFSGSFNVQSQPKKGCKLEVII